MPVTTEKGIVRGTYFRGSTIQIDIEVKVQLLRGFRGLEQPPLREGDEAFVFIHKIYGFDGDKKIIASNINAYLLDAPNIFVAVKDDFGLRIVLGTETDDNAVNMRLLSRLAVPTKRPMRKIDMNVVEKRFPKRGDRIPLTNRVRRYKCGAKILAASKVGGFFVPSGNIIKVARVLPAVKNRVDVRFLRGVHDTRPDKRRIAYDVVWFGTNIFPVKLKSVTFMNVRVTF